MHSAYSPVQRWCRDYTQQIKGLSSAREQVGSSMNCPSELQVQGQRRGVGGVERLNHVATSDSDVIS